MGEDVKHFKPGDRVFSDSGISCGECDECKKENYGKCKNCRSVGTINAWDGCFAEYMLIPEFNAYHLPENVSLEEAALIEPAAISLDAFSGFEVTSDMTIAVIGIGAIGMSAIWLAKYFGAKKVIAIGRNDNKLAVAAKIGADVVINNTKTACEEAVLEETDGKGADLVIETSGSETALVSAIKMTRAHGRISIVSFYEKDINGIPMDSVVINCITVKGAAGSYGNPPRVAEIMANYKTKLTPIITHKVSFDKCLDVFENKGDFTKDRVKVLIDFD